MARIDSYEAPKPFDPRETNEPAYQRNQLLSAVHVGNALLKRQVELLEQIVANTRGFVTVVPTGPAFNPPPGYVVAQADYYGR